MKKILLEFDLAGAEWVVTAYLTGDPNMIKVARGTESPHVVTAALITDLPYDVIKEENKLLSHETDPNRILELRQPLMDRLRDATILPRTMTCRQAGKKSNHGLNYGMRYRRFALENEMPETDAKPIVDLYSKQAYPGLRDYWKGILEELRRDRTLTNCFGRKIRMLDEWGPDLHMAAYSFKPQSTVFDVCRQAFIRIYEAGGLEEFLAQKHDSILYQYPCDWEKLAEFIYWVVNDAMAVPLDYSTGVFTLGVDLKAGFNWGSYGDDNPGGMREIDTSGTPANIAERLSVFKDAA